MKTTLLYGIAAFLILMCSSCRSTGQPNTIDNYMSGLVKDHKVAGAAIAISKNGTWVLSKPYGYADIEGKIEVSVNTEFGIMSITKTFVACAVMQLVQGRKIDLDAPITKYVEKLPTAYSGILIHHLLTHSSGMADYVEEDGYMAQANRSQTPMEILQPVLKKPLRFKPGEKSAYSNSGYFLLGLAIEKASGLPLKDYLFKNIFAPLGMQATYLDEAAPKSEKRAKGYSIMNGKLQEVNLLNPSQYWAAGGIVSTLGDMMKWNEALQNGRLLPSTVIDQMMRPSVLSDGTMSEYGLGFELLNTPSLKAAGSNGAGIGFNAANMQFVNQKLTILVLTNTTNGNSTMIAKSLFELMTKGDIKGIESAGTQEKDQLDSLVYKVFSNPVTAGKEYFADEDAYSKFRSEISSYIEQQGKLADITRRGEKKNPETVVRRYQLNFEKGTTAWIIIFSQDGKIMVTNHQ